jgi:hypothetical protein
MESAEAMNLDVLPLNDRFARVVIFSGASGSRLASPRSGVGDRFSSRGSVA